MTLEPTRRQIAALLAATAAVLASPWMGDAMASDKRLSSSLTIEQIKDRVTQDLRLGMSLEEVKEYFVRNDIEHGYYKSSNSVLAMIKNIRGWRLLIDKDAQIIVKFDRAHRISGIEVKPIFTGP